MKVFEKKGDYGIFIAEMHKSVIDITLTSGLASAGDRLSFSEWDELVLRVNKARENSK